MEKPLPLNGSKIPGSDHVIRYVGPRHIDNGVVNGEAFRKRPDEIAPSVNWLEWFEPPIEKQVEGVRRLRRLTYSKNGVLAKLNVEQTARYVRESDVAGLELSFVHNPLEAKIEDPIKSTPPREADPSHGLIYGVPVNDPSLAAMVNDLIAQCIIPPNFPTVPLR